MNRLILLIIFIPHFIYGQSKIQHEPERLLNKVLNEKYLSEFAKENKLQRISFFRDSLLSSSIEFDKNGNSIREIGMENDYVRETIRKFDKQDREIETKYFTPKGEYSYGYYYKYENGAHLMYKLEDSLLFRKRTSLKGENISTYSEYDKNGEIVSKNVYVKDNDMKWLLETRFQNDRIYVQYRYEYLDNKKYVTKVQFDRNGTKVTEKRYLDEIKNHNKIEHYTSDDERLFTVDTFDKNDNLIKMELFDENGNITLTEISKYNSKGQLTKQTKVNSERDQKTVYVYEYDKLGKIELVTKEFNGETEYFRYKYEIH